MITDRGRFKSEVEYIYMTGEPVDVTINDITKYLLVNLFIFN